MFPAFQFPTTFLAISSPFPGSSSLTAHPSFRSGLKIRNHRMSRAWMGARLPFRNTYQKGIYPFWGQARYYAPDLIGDLSRMGGSTHNGHILTKPRRALSQSSTCPFPPLYIHIFSLYVIMYLFRNFTSLFTPSLTHHTYRPHEPFPSIHY